MVIILIHGHGCALNVSESCLMLLILYSTFVTPSYIHASSETFFPLYANSAGKAELIGFRSILGSCRI